VDAVTPVKTVDTERIYEEWGKASVFYCKALYKCIVLSGLVVRLFTRVWFSFH